MKALLLLLLASQVHQATPLDFELAKGQFAYGVAFKQSSVPLPTPTPTPGPTPTPAPGGKCEACNGTGVVRPDGRIEVPCQACGGDGVVGAQAVRIAPIRQELAAATPNKYLWLDNIPTAKSYQKDTKQPMVVLFVGPEGTCLPCDTLQNMLALPYIQDILKRAICVRIVADEGNEVAAEWDILQTPAMFIVDPDFKRRTELSLSRDPKILRDTLDSHIGSYEQSDSRNTDTRAAIESTKPATLTRAEEGDSEAEIQPVLWGRRAFAGGGSAGGQVMIVQGSAGGYGSVGGGSAGYSAGGSAGGYGGYQYAQPSYGYYAQPQYYSQPSYYSSPSYGYGGGYSGGYYNSGYSGGYGGGYGGGFGACGPGGCY